MDWILNPDIWIALITLTALEIVLGIDNIVFISILAGKLPPEQQERARRVGLGLAMITRVGLLFSLAWIIRLTAPLFTIAGQAISGRDLILIGGGSSCWRRPRTRSMAGSKGRRNTAVGARRRRSPASSSRFCCWTSSSRSTR